jgi:DNA-binding transcriptional LysR family regulator
VAQYVLPPVLAGFHKKFNEIEVVLSINNTGQIEQALINKDIDLGIVEGQSKSNLLKYSAFIKDELVLVGKINHRLIKKGSIKPDELLKTPLLLREPGSGTLEVIAHALKSVNIKVSELQNEMQLGSTESIKSYLLHADCLAFLSIHSILKELHNKEVGIIDIKGLSIDRMFYFIQEHGQAESLPDLFMKFVRHYNFR